MTAVYDQFASAYVSLKFSPQGALTFEKITGENIKKRLAIVLDGEVYSAPVIQDRIAGGEASISGDFTTDEANDLAVVLRAGSLPAPVNILGGLWASRLCRISPPLPFLQLPLSPPDGPLSRVRHA